MSVDVDAVSTGGSSSFARGVAVNMTGVVHLYGQRGSDVVALRGVDLDIDAGEMVALLGPSGMGKTTVLRLMAGVMKASAGVVSVGGHDIGRMSVSERRRLRAGEISYMVQGTIRNVLPHATAIENVWFAQQGAIKQGHAPPWAPREVLAMLGLQDLARERLAELPRGLQQQVAIVSCVGTGPRLILADEPTAQLTREDALCVTDLLTTINRDLQTTVVIVTHDPTVAGRFPRTVTISDGRVGSEGMHGVEYAVVDGRGSVQLPPDVLAILPPNTRVRLIRSAHGVELRAREVEP